ncbi:MAG: aminoglycoside phosphotransferase family protein [Elusimicrobia bacterium]|nr:aminoglycoside phosphotransferase family protein [Elusimicrobiota bacterium]
MRKTASRPGPARPGATRSSWGNNHQAPAGLARVAERFRFPGRLVAVQPMGTGNVNDTYLVVFRTPFSEERGILQRINQRVFKKPEWILENMRVVTKHVHRRLEREADAADRIWQLPRLIPTKEGRSCHVDENGEWWRSMTVIASAASYDRVQGPEHAMEVGGVLGQFHRLVSDLSPARLRDTLPGFHVTPRYLDTYDKMLEKSAARKRLDSCAEAKRAARFIGERRTLAGVLEGALRRGELRLRTIHGDPKVNNVMIDDLTDKGTSIVDLDTVKPGLIHYDFGDALRSVCNPAGEETQNLGDVRFDTRLCEAFVRGYMPRAREFLAAADRKYLYDCVRLIAFELGLRFFQDYLAGDVYFKVRYPGHNLQRARVQFRLCESIEAREAAIRKVLNFG